LSTFFRYLFYRCPSHRNLHSFPTRRSSDLEGIQKLAFTGSTEVGYTVAKAAAERLIPSTLELGGKSANIVFKDAPWERALEGVQDRKSTRLNSSHVSISYAVFCLKKKNTLL